MRIPRKVIASVALATIAMLAACAPSESARSNDSATEAPTPTVAGSMMQVEDEQPTPTTTQYVPAANPTPIAKPTGCRDYGYAGKARDDDPTIDTYWLTDPPESQADAAFAIAQTLCIAGGRYIPTGDVRFKKADYSLRQLQDWYSELNQTAWSIEGVYGGGVSEGINRIKYDVMTQRGADKLTELIEATGVPPEAVIIEQLPRANISEPPPQPWAEPDLTLALKSEDEILSGQGGTFTVSLKNHDFSRLKVEYNGAYPVNVVIYSEDGQQVWQHFPPFMILPGGASHLWPWSSLSFDVEWPGTDDDSLPLEPGLYWVRGFFDFRLDGSGRLEMSTNPVPLHITAP